VADDVGHSPGQDPMRRQPDFSKMEIGELDVQCNSYKPLGMQDNLELEYYIQYLDV
jgi:hypothetical protein